MNSRFRALLTFAIASLGILAARPALAQEAKLTGFTPSQGPVGTTVTMVGTNFTKIQTLQFSPAVSATFHVVNDTQLTTTVPLGAVTGPIKAQTATNTTQTSTAFTVTGSGGSGSPKILSFSASQTMVYTGKPLTLAWNVTGATSLSISPIGTVTGTSLVVNPAASTTYTLTATNASGNATSSIGVVVAASPKVKLAPEGTIVRSNGGTRTIQVIGKPAWTATTTSPWIAITSSPSGTGNGSIAISVAPNPAATPRSGQIKIAGQICTVYEDGQANLVHPRLFFNPSDIARYQSWAVPQNVSYQVLMDIVGQAKAAMDTRFGTANWKDNGIFTFSPETTEDYAVLFAFMYQLETDPTLKADYAARAKTMLFYIFDQAVLGPAANVPFRDPLFSIKDRARFFGQTYPLIIDYVYPTLTPAQRATAQTVLLRYCGESKAAYVGSGNNGMGLKASANNYQLAHFRNVTMWSEVMDPADDPLVNPNLPASTLGNTLHSYNAYVTGRWLSDLWTLFDHGSGKGGLPIEGTLYGLSYGWFRDGLRTIHNTGLDDASLAGPQTAMLTSTFWDDWLAGYFHLMVNTPLPPAGAAYVGNVYEQFGYCDLIRVWSIPENMPMLASAILYDRSVGNTVRQNAEYWALRNSLEGGPNWLVRNPTRQWFNQPAGADAPLQFVARDPFLAPPTDPRPAMPTVFESAGVRMVIGRTGWDPLDTLLSFRSSYVTENHTTGDAGTFCFYRKGNMLTSAVLGYTSQDILNCSEYQNTLTIQNDIPSDLNWFEGEISSRGGQWIFGQATGDSTFLTSNGPGYLAADTDLTKLYNRQTNKSAVTDVKKATRTLIWLQPDYVVVYDRATTGKAGRFKRFNLHLPSAPSISGKVATATTANGQKLYVTSLLPSAGVLTSPAMVADGQAMGGTMVANLMVQDPSGPTDVRFLHLLQGADAGAAMVNPKLLSSSAGDAFEGMTFKRWAVLFPHNPFTAASPFTGVTYSVKTAATDHFLAGLSPNVTYDISIVAVVGGSQITVVPGTHFMADKAGVLTFKTSQVGP